MKAKVLYGLLVLSVVALVVIWKPWFGGDSGITITIQESNFARTEAITAVKTPANLPPDSHQDTSRTSWPLSQREVLWKQDVKEPEFAAFADWAIGYAGAPFAAQTGLKDEGVRLAKARLTVLADLIQKNPQRALELAVPLEVRQSMPAEVQALLEEPVNSRGDYEVVCVLPVPGHEQETTPIIRSAAIQGEQYQVFTYGKGLEYVTRKDVPLNGVAVPIAAATTPPTNPIGLQATRLMALDPQPVRRLDESELAAYRVGFQSEPLCAATGRPWTVEGTPVAVEFGGRIYPFSALRLAEEWATTNMAAAGLDTPQPPPNLPTAESSYTEGRKRFLLLRVDFPDYQVEALSTNSALTLMNNLSNFMAEISYYKHIIAAVGEGTDITPTMRMSQNASAYDNGGLSRLYPEAKDVAATNYGYDISQYDFLFVVTGGRPSYGYAGLGYVGGVGFHLANGYFDVRTSAHEFGHNLGLSHANWWDTGGQSMIGTGSSEEYGDPFDTMGGSGGGARHFSSYNKNRINWIPAGDCPTVATSGVYRLYAQDLAQAPVGVRGLRLTRSGGDYWIEFRQLWTGNKALMNGVSLRWVSGATTLLDTMPGSSGGKDDHPVTIGRTFSDPARNYHFTPLGKGHTYPESIDVAVQLGPFPTNQSPSVMAHASATAASVGQTVTFTAEASDPNGDLLAYAWDFGDGDYSVDNNAVTTHSFTSTGEYYVECAVSDLKGGVARHAVIVRVGSPTTFSITGRVLGTNNLPVPGIKVSVDASHYAFTESDGAYTLTRLAAGSYTVSALEPVSGAYTFLNPAFSNPVTVGPNFQGADFIALSSTQQLYVPLLARGVSWKYLDNGSDQGTAWEAPAFDDAGWSNGAAILGFGEGNEGTVLSYGTNADNKYITYYFRRTLVVTNPADFSSLQLEVLRDDGVRVLVNGAEAFRDNLPAGPLTYTTLAPQAVEPTSYLTANLSPGLFVAGTNVIAAEVHQSSVTSSDLAFDLALKGLSTASAALLNSVYIASPRPNQAFVRPTNVVVNATAYSGSGPVSRVEFFVDGTRAVEDTAAPYVWVWSVPPAGTYTLKVVATMGGGVQRTSTPVVIRVTDPLPPPVALSLVQTGAFWKYWSTATGAPPAWAQADYADGAWPGGNAQLGYGEGDEATQVPFGGDPNNRWITAYFRHAFPVNDPSAITNLTLRLKRDDGAIVYLNGQEVVRDYLPAGTVTPLTLATQAVPDDGASFVAFNLDPLGLRPGTNVLAVEVHQSAANSSDLSFDLALDALATTNRARGLWLAAPTNGATVALPGQVTVSAQVVAGSGRGVTRVEFYAGSDKVGEDTVSPYSIVWSDPPAGTHSLTAVATDTASATLTSAPVSITVTAPPLSTAFVSFGETWKYLDDGSNQGTNWVGRTFDDRLWLSGAAKLGYGGDGEVTTLSYGPDPNQRQITAFFRKGFFVQNRAAYDRLRLQLVRDDGAVVYLNGLEVFRDNLSPGLVSFNSLAITTLGGTDETTPVEVILDTSRLASGTNVIAVEVHQASLNSSDAGFDLALSGLRATNTAEGVYLTSPANGARFHTPVDVLLSAHAAASNGPITTVAFYAGVTRVAEASAPSYRTAWSNAPAGAHTLTARATDGVGLWLTSAPISIVIGEPPPPVFPVSATLLPAGADWQYWDNVAAPGAGWAGTAFDVSAWPSGPARFGWGLDGEVTPLTEGRVTHYFRRWFTVSNPAPLTELVFQLARDDGAMVYLNGREVFRSNMPAGTVTASTLATATVNTPDETTYFETAVATSGSGLVAGSNLVAVELHQASTTTSDAGFDLQLLGFGTTEGRVYLTTPAEGASFLPTAIVPVEALPLAPAGASVSKVEFFVNGVKLGETTVAPHRLSWGYPPLGTHVLLARLTDSAGRSLDSAPITISVTRELVTTTFISANAVWKYLDDGSNQTTNWAQPGYSDTAWAAGPARLGYGGDGEVTTVRSNRNDGTRILTTYFRRAFVAPPNAAYTNLTFRLLRDDGAVVWLNGREAYRHNMPATGSITYTTLAAGTVSGADEQTFFTTTLSATNLVAGTNLVGVEVHQINNTSSDLGFNLELIGYGYADDSAPPALSVTYSEGIVEVSWPASAVGWQLYSAPALLTPRSNWTPVDSPVYPVNDRNVVYILPNGGSQFYRLTRP